MKQVLRKGLKEIVVVDVPDPVLQAHHVLIRPSFSLISSGTETASLHQEGVLSELRHNPSHLHKIAAAVRTNGPQRTLAEVKAKFSEYAVLGYSGAGRVAAVDRHVTDIEPGQSSPMAARVRGMARRSSRGATSSCRCRPKCRSSTRPSPPSAASRCRQCASPHIGLGERVVVVGLGMVGQLVAQLAQLAGPGHRRRPAAGTDGPGDRLGAEHVLAADAAGEIRGVTGGRGADCVIVAAAAKSAAPVHAGTGDVRRPGADCHCRRSADRIPVACHVHEGESRSSCHGRMDREATIPDTRNRARIIRSPMSDGPRTATWWSSAARWLAGPVTVAPLDHARFELERRRGLRHDLDPATKSLAVLSVPGSGPAAERRRMSRGIASKSGEATPSRTALRVALVGAGNIARWAHLPSPREAARRRTPRRLFASGARGHGYATPLRCVTAPPTMTRCSRDPE